MMLVFLFGVTPTGATFGQQTAEEFVNNGKAKIITDHWVEAITNYSKAIQLDPKYARPLHLNRGLAKNHEGDFDEFHRRLHESHQTEARRRHQLLLPWHREKKQG